MILILIFRLYSKQSISIIIISFCGLGITQNDCLQSDMSECCTTEILALEMEVNALLGVETAISLEILGDISNQLVDILSTSRILKNDISSVANILSGIIM